MVNPLVRGQFFYFPANHCFLPSPTLIYSPHEEKCISFSEAYHVNCTFPFQNSTECNLLREFDILVYFEEWHALILVILLLLASPDVSALSFVAFRPCCCCSSFCFCHRTNEDNCFSNHADTDLYSSHWCVDCGVQVRAHWGDSISLWYPVSYSALYKNHNSLVVLNRTCNFLLEINFLFLTFKCGI